MKATPSPAEEHLAAGAPSGTSSGATPCGSVSSFKFGCTSLRPYPSDAIPARAARVSGVEGELKRKPRAKRKSPSKSKSKSKGAK